ncbi:hypothetical protein [Candidatus Bathycorpusculum sp.]|uniref:hypothetical protein n=1 Tax=Candidatus Bathycorpusculum sp. TaxID=2994959 RepID=UPI0028371BB5|nr:hypothetical protein [Candidatus Termitimicrobium sp.]MCL2685751.1 hypothetical protein [Candidatus Termitimicrobium sp.]
MKNYKKNVGQVVSIVLVLAVFLSLVVVPVSFGAVLNDCQVRVPLVVDLSYVIAGAQFVFEYSAGLEFVSYEKSATVYSALTTPVVVKNGYACLGFYNADNLYVPKDGKLDVGYLVFNCLTDDPQQITLTEIKLVQIVDDGGATRNEFLAPVEIKVSSGKVLEVSSVGGGDGGSGGALLVDDKVSSVGDVSDGGSGGALLVDDKVSSVGDVADASLGGAQNLLRGASEGSWLPVGFWVVLVCLFVVAFGAGVFVIMKKRSVLK